MGEKRFYCDEFGEYRSYAIYDCSKVEKTKEDFWDNGEEVYDIIAYEEYLEENDCMLISNEVEDMLNEQQFTIDKLDQENADLFGARIKAQEEWEKCTDKLKAKILVQQATITKLNKQIEQLHLAIDDLLSHTSCDEIKKENEQLRLELETHKHPLWSTREAERRLSEVTNNLADEVKKNGLLNEEINQLRIENMRLKKKGD